jgi:hypothetical protein
MTDQRMDKNPGNSSLFSNYLPDDFHPAGEFNLKNNTRVMVILNIVGFILFLAAVLLVQIYTARMRPGQAGISLSFEVDNLAQAGLFILFLLLDLVLLVILHEGVHGLCFWLITGKRPVFSLGPGYAAAAAPGCYIRRGPYLVTALSPLIVLTAAGLMLIPFVSSGLLFHVILITVMNIAGAVGDLWVAGGIITRHGPLLVQDHGDRVEVYQP